MSLYISKGRSNNLNDGWSKELLDALEKCHQKELADIMRPSLFSCYLLKLIVWY